MTSPDLFTWQREVIASQLSQTLRLTALRLGLDSRQSSGQEVVINAPDAAGDLACSERTVWRHLGQLVEAGWLRQTARPTYSGREASGRRARYQLTLPHESPATPALAVSDESPQSSDTPSCGKSDDSPQSCDTGLQAVSDDLTQSSDTPPLTVADENASHLPNPAESSDTTTGDVGTLSAFGSSNNSSSCSGDVAIEILAGKLRAYTALASIRTDKLKPEQADQIRALIELHGDAVLVARALRTLRPDNPPQTIQAFLGGWLAMPAPGSRALAAVPDPPCTEPGHSGTVHHCVQCAGERNAGGLR